MTALGLTVTAVVPTKNRPEFLAATVAALLGQTVVPEELIVVDQSECDLGRRFVTALVDGAPAEQRPLLRYLLDTSINGAAGARNLAMDLARGDVVIFCDDDVLPEPDVIERLLAHYRATPGWAGLAPVITNNPRPGILHRLHCWLFCRGPFRDERQPIYWSWQRRTAALVPVRMFAGAMMSFRREALAGVRHDSRYRAASTGEDIDLCWTLVGRGARLAIATDARIVHRRAPRPKARPEEAMLTSWGFLYDKHVPKTAAARVAFAWYVTGVLVGATGAALRNRSRAPLASALTGLQRLRDDYAGSPFLAPRPPHQRR